MRPLPVLAGIATTAALVAGAAFAGDFASEAERFYNRTCTRARLIGVNAFVCELWQRVEELGEGIPGPPGPRGDQGPPGPPGQMLKVFDANGVELGEFIDLAVDDSDLFAGIVKRGPFARFYYAPLHRFVDISHKDGLLGEPVHLAYTTTDCSGTPYIGTSSASETVAYHVVFTDSINEVGTFYIVDSDVPAETINQCSTKEDGTCKTFSFGCGVSEQQRAVTEIVVALPNPVVLPIRIGFE